MATHHLNSSITRIESEKIIEGLRIPTSLDRTSNVNFVLTQESGKLKPKDLKIAIERNRAEKLRRQEEQNRFRKDGAPDGFLDLRSILIEENASIDSGDPFKRQIREMAFLSDIDDVQKLETEKMFRISEDYLGSPLLSTIEVEKIKQQRQINDIYRARNSWERDITASKSLLYLNNHAVNRAGVHINVAESILGNITPSFDTNQNDIWKKRLNTMRRFVALVSRWVYRERVKRRLNQLLTRFHENGVFTREEVLAFIESENILKSSQNSSSSQNQKAATSTSSSAPASSNFLTGASVGDKIPTLACLTLDDSSAMLQKRRSNLAILKNDELSSQFNFTSNMAQRNLFPEFLSQDLSDSTVKDSANNSNSLSILNEPIRFNDRSFFHSKLKPDYVKYKYSSQRFHISCVDMPLCDTMQLRKGSEEEFFVRPGADCKFKLDSSAETSATSNEPGAIARIRGEEKTAAAISIPKDHSDSQMSSKQLIQATNMPAWLVAKAQWSTYDRDMYSRHPAFRTLLRDCKSNQLDEDWLLRPLSGDLLADELPQLRAKYVIYTVIDILSVLFTFTTEPILSFQFVRWNARAGFRSANFYLLGMADCRSLDTDNLMLQGPTLSDFYKIDSDRHVSGLNCFRLDDQRDAIEWDPDITRLQTKADPKDHLTDSESDDEERILNSAPTVAAVKQVLKPKPAESIPDPSAKAPKGAKAAAPVAPAPTASQLPNESDCDIDAGNKKAEQVELLRDRKTLDLEATWTKSYRKIFDSNAARLKEISSKTEFSLAALQLQLPFHAYESDVYLLEKERNNIEESTPFVEINPAIDSLNQSTDRPVAKHL